MEFKELKLALKNLFKEYVRKHIKRILFALILSIIVAGSTSGIAWLLDPAVKKIFIDQDKTLAWLIPIAIIFAFTAKGVSLYFARINIIRVGEEVSGELKKKVANNILNSDIQTLEGRHSGKYISNVMFDTIRVQNLVSTGVLNLMKDSFSLVALVTLMFYQNWKLALFALLMMPLAGGLAKRLGKRVGKVANQAGEVSGRLTTFLSEIFQGSKIIRIYQKENEEAYKANNLIDELIEKNVKIQSVQIRATPIMEALTGIMIAGFIFYSGNLISAGELTVNSFFSFLAAMMLAYQPIRSLATINMIAYEGGVAFNRVAKIINAPIKIINDDKLPNLTIKKSEINFEDVSFRYLANNDKAINNINLKINGGSMAALVGHSGAGKSTILNLLPRFYDPQQGSIKIDGQNISKINLNSLRKYISLVSQDIILFDDTVEANILYANPSATKDELINACKFAAANEFISKLPNGYQTIIGENGVKLSGGQKQRISIARAVLKDSPIILLDEATSSLDADSEEIVQNAIKNLTKNKTTVVIAHRLSTIFNADKIFVIKGGELIDAGKHSDLLDKSQEYKSLYKKQLT